MKKKNPIEEARRYVDNARTTLKENGELDERIGSYQDEKYVRAAGNFLWLGVLMALDAVFQVRKDRRTRVDIKDYIDAVGKRDLKLIDWVDNGYKVMHLSMTYDGIQNKKICEEGFEYARKIIDRCEAMMPVA